MHFSLSHTLAVVSHEPLRRVPNFPEDKVQTGMTGRKAAGLTLASILKDTGDNRPRVTDYLSFLC